MDTKIANWESFEKLVNENPEGIVLLEGKRDIPPEWAEKAEKLAMFLTQKFPRLRFRSGNATGSDEVFSRGVAAVDATRLHIIAPYEGHRKSYRFESAIYDAPSTVPSAHDDEVAYKTIAATPRLKSLIENRHSKKCAKAAYLIRDTMKVLGDPEKYSPAICGIFYANPENPLDGGTGHTIRVCLAEGIPVVTQAVWGEWQNC